MQAFVWKEDNTYVIKEAVAGVAIQGKTTEDAIENIREAVELYFEEVQNS